MAQTPLQLYPKLHQLFHLVSIVSVEFGAQIAVEHLVSRSTLAVESTLRLIPPLNRIEMAVVWPGNCKLRMLVIFGL